MELSKNLISNLIQLGINPDSLSGNEKKFISQINNVFEEFKEINENLSTGLMKNKFNKSIVAERVECSRQTLYKNPTLVVYLEWCEKQADSVQLKVNSSNLIAKEKYDRLKNENSNLRVNIVDDALKDAEIDRLAKENKEMKKRIENLIRRFEEKNNEVNQLKKKTKN